MRALQAQLFAEELDAGPRTIEGTDAERESVELFALTPDRLHIERTIRRRDGSQFNSRLPVPVTVRAKAPSQAQLAAISDLAFLRSTAWPERPGTGDSLRSADLFSGCGMMTLGLWEACRAIGRSLHPVLGADVDSTALGVYKRNFPKAATLATPIETHVTGALGAGPSTAEEALISRIGSVDFLVGGPPCQGHSDLNNHTRRDDPKNRLYERMARFAELFKPAHIICENVSAVLHDKGRVVEKTMAWLKRLGYMVDQQVADVASLGVPQRRRRHVLVASLRHPPDIQRSLSRFAREPREISWALGDLLRVKGNSALDKASVIGATNQQRIAYLFRRNEYDLPDRLRPDCHRLKTHSYKSVYGRMHWDRPAQTITSGFTSMGQGRYVHPKLPRTLTPHEAARLQFIPDFFELGEDTRRTALANMIGNAVPAKLIYVLALDLLR